MKKLLLTASLLASSSMPSLASQSELENLCEKFSTIAEAVMIMRYSGVSESRSMRAAVSAMQGNKDAEEYTGDIVFYAYSKPYEESFAKQYESVKNTAEEIFEFCMVDFSVKA